MRRWSTAPARRPATADVAVDGDRITAVGDVGAARRTIDADGATLTPGFVDVHTHYDGQATWDERMTPSSWHGVTTVVAGNCGVGFAPVRSGDHQVLVELMEGVEDIPGTALHEGLSWEWESFGDFLDVLDRRHRDVDVAAQLPHGALRLYVMGARGAAREPATRGGDRRRWPASPARRSTRARSASPPRGPATTGRAAATGRRPSPPRPTSSPASPPVSDGPGKGVLQVVSDFANPGDELGAVLGMAEASGRPLSISVTQVPTRPGAWRDLLAAITDANERGMVVTAQVASRPVGIILGLQATLSPIGGSATARAIGFDPETLARRTTCGPRSWPRWPSTGPCSRGPTCTASTIRPTTSRRRRRASRPRRRASGVAPEALAYDLVMADGGHGLLYVPFLNYADGDLEPTREMLTHPHAVLGLADGGAHVGTICDASFPTTMLTHWVRDRSRGPRLPLAHVVAMQTARTARMVGLLDRGVVAPGMRADLNLIDLDGLRLRPPTIAFDLPAGGKRFLQRADGYLHTFVAGEETYASGEPTGALPGRLVRGGQPPPP